MTLFHGSQFIIDNPRYNGGKPYNDYGRGFYCTEDPDLAREWSVAYDRDGYVNRYEMDTAGLRILDLNNYPVITWLAILLENRTFDISAPLAREAAEYIHREFLIGYEDHDIITGFRADDSYFSFSQDFISGVISYEQLCEAMRLGELGDQVVLKSRRAYDRIRYKGYEAVSRDIWYPKKRERDEKARSRYFSLDKRYIKGSLYITKIIDEEMRINDNRLQ